MLSYFDLRKGTIFIYQGVPHEVLDFLQMKKAQREGIGQTKLKNLITGQIIFKNFHQNEEFEEAEIEKVKVKFLYSKRNIFYFCLADNPSFRFELKEEQIGESAKFLIPNLILEGIRWEEKIINVILPIKVQLRVKEAPPGVKGDRAQSGTKTVVLENGTRIQAPLFIEQGDLIEVNTETGEYVRRL
jgi:elongation factor P